MASSCGILKSSSVGPLDSRHCDFTCGVCPVCCGACTECNVLSCAKVIFVRVMGKERRCVIWIFDSLTNPKPKSPLLDQEKPAFYGAELLYRSEEVGTQRVSTIFIHFCRFTGNVVLPSALTDNPLP